MEKHVNMYLETTFYFISLIVFTDVSSGYFIQM